MSDWLGPKTIFLIDEDSKRAVSSGAAGSASCEALERS